MATEIDVVIEFQPYPGSTSGGPWAPPPVSVLDGVTTQASAYTALGFTQSNALGLVVGNPMLGQLGIGTINATAIYVNGVAVAAVAVPSAQLLGGNGSTLHGITVGSGLALTGTTLTSTGGVTIPTAPLLSGTGSALAAVTAIDGLVIGANSPAAATVTDLNFTGNFSFGGSVLMQSINRNSLTFGIGAGSVLPFNDTETIAFGTNALNRYTGIVSENTVVGWFSCRSLTGSMVSTVTTASSTASTTLSVADTGMAYIGVLANGYFAIAPGITDGTTIVSFTSVPGVAPTALTMLLSAPATVASGTTVYFAPTSKTTTATTTVGTILTFANTTGITVGQAMVTSGGGNAYPVVQVTATTSTTVTVNSNVTVASGTACYFATKTGIFNTVMGVNTMGLSTQDSNNTIFGIDTFRDAVGGNNTGIGATNFRDGTHYNDTALGYHALWSSGASGAYTFSNVALGANSMSSTTITTANSNVFAGFQTAANGLTSAAANCGGGYQAMLAITSGNFNSSWGYQTLMHLTSGGSNNAFGALSLAALTTGNNNFAGGRSSLSSMTTAWFQTAVGDGSMSNYVGTGNTANSANAVFGASAGAGSVGATYTQATLLGAQAGKALLAGAGATFVGTNSGLAVTNAGPNLLLGANVGSVNLITGVGNVYISPGQTFAATTIDAASGQPAESNTFRLGNNAVNTIRATGINTASPAFFLDWLPTSTTFANDAAAATGGVLVGQIYRNGSAVQCRIS